MDSESPQPPTSSSSTSTGFFGWLRSLGISRSPDERWFAGVAGGIAQRSGIDPLLVRGIFIALAILGGPGILLYLAGWLLLPDRAGRIEAEEVSKGRASSGVIIAAVVIGIWLLTSIFSGIRFSGVGWGLWRGLGLPWWISATFTWIFWLAVLGAVGYIIHRIIIAHGTTENLRPEPERFAEAPRDTGETPSDRARDWSAQYVARYEERKLGAAHVLITLALALIAGGLAALAVSQTNIPSDTRAPVLVAGLIAATAVLAVSMMFAGLRGRNSGTIGFLGSAGVIAFAALTLLPAGTTYTLIGDSNLTATTPASFSLIGDTNLDLALYDSLPEHTEVDITHMVGEVNLQLSNERPAQITMDVGAGSIEGHGMRDPSWGDHSGVFNRRTIVVNEDATGPLLTVNVRLGAGTINITQAE